jgi:hypothetical protein
MICHNFFFSIVPELFVTYMEHYCYPQNSVNMENQSLIQNEEIKQEMDHRVSELTIYLYVCVGV